VKVPIPADVQGVFGKKAFKKSLKTTDKAVAIVRSGPLIAHFKAKIEDARGNPTGQLEDYLEKAAQALLDAKADQDVTPDDIAGLEDELRDRLLAAHNVNHLEELPSSEASRLLDTYKITTGQLTPFDAPLPQYSRYRQVEIKTAAKDTYVISMFAKRVSAIQEVDKSAVREFVRYLSEEEGRKNRTIKDNLSTLRTYWKWLQENNLADENRVNPFVDVTLPQENRKDAAAAARLPFTVDQIRTLDQTIMAGNNKMLQVIFKLALYTGCRIEELAQLETSNVTEDAINIVRAKTAAGNRTIPVHDALRPVVVDLLSHGGDGSGYLLPDLTVNSIGVRSAQVSKQFGYLKTKLGFDSRYVFHSIRKTVSTLFEQAGVPEGVAADILGHEKPTMTYGLYAGGSSMSQKREAISKLDYGFNI
jgi:integrase